MGTLTPQQQRTLRRRHKHERQAVIFGSMIAGLALAGLGATAVYTGAMDANFLTRDFTTPTPTAVAVPEDPDPPCLPPDTLPVANESIQVKVLNATTTAGLASTTAAALTERGFVVSGTDNYVVEIPTGSRIQFGETGLAAAYTLAANIDGAALILDTREDPGVDLVLGGTWNGLLALDAMVLDPTTPLLDIPGCVPLEQARLTAAPGPTTPPVEAEVPVEGEAPAEGEVPAEG